MTIEEKYNALLSLKWGEVENKNTSSWAIWKEPEGDLSIVKNLRSNIKDVSMFDKDCLESTLGILKTDCVFVGLNASEGNDKFVDKSRLWYSFHSAKQMGHDYILRWAFMEPEIREIFWGSYITDIFKDYARTDSSSVVEYYKNPKNNDELRDQLGRFDKELYLLKPKKLIVMGIAADYFVRKYYSKRFEDSIITINHYAGNRGYEAYSEYFKSVLLEHA